MAEIVPILTLRYGSQAFSSVIEFFWMDNKFSEKLLRIILFKNWFFSADVMKMKAADEKLTWDLKIDVLIVPWELTLIYLQFWHPASVL